MKEGTLIFIRNLQVVLEVGGGWALGLCIGKGWVGGGEGQIWFRGGSNKWQGGEKVIYEKYARNCLKIEK